MRGNRIRFIPMDGISHDGSTEVRWIEKDRAEVSSGVRCDPGEILLAKITPCFENGKLGRVPQIDSSPWMATTEVFTIRPNETIDADFLWWVLASPFFRRALAPTMQGATGRQRLQRISLERHLIPLPPLAEQRAIAGVLGAVQRAKEATEKVIAATKELKKSLMRHLFTYGPVPLSEAPNVTLKQTEIGKIPEHWDAVSLGMLERTRRIRIKSGFPSGKHNSGGTGVLQLRPFNVTVDGHISLSTRKYVPAPSADSPYWVGDKDIIFNNTNSTELVGKTALLKGPDRLVISNHMTAIRVITRDTLDARWLSASLHRHWEQGEFARRCRRYVNQSSIGLEALRATVIPQPPYMEQDSASRMMERVEQRVESEAARLSALDALFQSLLHHLMSGQVRVPPFGQEPGGEDRGEGEKIHE